MPEVRIGEGLLVSAHVFEQPEVLEADLVDEEGEGEETAEVVVFALLEHAEVASELLVVDHGDDREGLDEVGRVEDFGVQVLHFGEGGVELQLAVEVHEQQVQAEELRFVGRDVDELFDAAELFARRLPE